MSSEMTVSEFMNLTKERKTEVIWNELFIRMTPVSEATRGVVNVLKGLGMAKGERLRLCEEIFPAATVLNKSLIANAPPHPRSPRVEGT